MKCSSSGDLDNAVKKTIKCRLSSCPGILQPDKNLTNNPVSNVCQVKIKMFIHMPHSVSII